MTPGVSADTVAGWRGPGIETSASPLGARPHGRVFASVFVLSLAVLIAQIALSRIFSYTVWYHFAYISITLALLGFGTAGSLLAAFPSLGSGPVRTLIGRYSAAAAATSASMLIVLGFMQVNPFFINTSIYEFAKFVAFIVIVTIPFLFAGLAISIALREAGSWVGRMYFWDLVGAGLGCALVVPLIDLLGTPRVVVLVAALFAVAGWIACGAGALGRRNLILAFSLVAASIPLPGALEFPPTKDKDISGWLATGRTFYSQWGSLFRTDLVGGRDEESRFGGYSSIGVSPVYQGAPPRFRMIHHDGGAGAIMYLTGGAKDEFEVFRHHILTAPYVVARDPDVMVIGVGGGADIVNAVTNGARSVTGVELDPTTVRLITKDFGDLTRGYLDRPEVAIQVGEGRSFARSAEGKFDLLQITGVDTLSALSSGAYVLAENFLYTTDAYVDFLTRLGSTGLLSVCSADVHPNHAGARHAPRFAALSFDALRRLGVAQPAGNVMIVGSSNDVALFEILTRLTPFTDTEVENLRAFARDNGFETWYLPGRPEQSHPLFRSILDGDDASREAFYDDSYLNLRATTDDNPFFFSYYKWQSLLKARREIDRGHTMATGQLVLMLLLLTSLLASAVAIVLPLLRVRGGATAMQGRAGFLAYFAALGAGFIFLEISFVQRFVLFLGYPTYSLTVTLFSFLVAAGIGANLSSRLPPQPRRVLPRLALALSLLVLFYAVALPPIFAALLGSSLAVRILATIALCAPLGGVLGMFFPFGIRHVAARNRDFVAWAWAANGCLTVVGSVACIMLATSWGFRAVSLASLVIYWLGVWGFLSGAAKGVTAPATAVRGT
ncbi:MAG: hypothetical protein HY899_07925 [Deltaproteobacteria bacterium]|nr:hypothetical protein [Deltaproteobacteria bacterium]